MFDDHQANNNPPSNLPTGEPEDMFAGVNDNTNSLSNKDSVKKDALSAGVLQSKQENNLENTVNKNINNTNDLDIAKQTESLNQVTQYKMKEPVLGKILFIILLVVVVILLLFAGWYVYGKFFSANSTNHITNNSQTNSVVNSSSLNVNTATNTKSTNVNNTAKRITSTVSSSSTDIANEQTTDKILFGQPIDTDGDGLDDIREKKLGTDIHKKDTDNDGLTDSDEVLIWHTNPLNSDTDGDGYPDGHEVKNGYNPVGPGKLYNIPTSTASSSN